MEPADYIVLQIDGDYATLQRTDAASEEPFFIARALLPEGIDEGSRLHRACMEYTLIE